MRNHEHLLPIAEERRVLLLDANSTSREARAKALRDRGMQVDCVGGSQDARMFWRPGAYEIVLIDFQTAGDDGRDFYRYAASNARKQKFGFYMNGAPYLTSSHRQCEAAATAAVLAPTAPPVPVEIDFTAVHPSRWRPWRGKIAVHPGRRSDENSGQGPGWRIVKGPREQT